MGPGISSVYTCAYMHAIICTDWLLSDPCAQVHNIRSFAHVDGQNGEGDMPDYFLLLQASAPAADHDYQRLTAG